MKNKDNGLELTIHPNTMVQSKFNKTRQSDGFVFPDSAGTFMLLAIRSFMQCTKRNLTPFEDQRLQNKVADICPLRYSTAAVLLNVVKEGLFKVVTTLFGIFVWVFINLYDKKN